MTDRIITALLAVSVILIHCAGCASRPLPTPMATVDIYMTDEGFFVITERGSDESIAYRFNVTEINPINPPTPIPTP